MQNDHDTHAEVLKAETKTYKDQLDAKVREYRELQITMERMKEDYETKKLEKWEQHSAELKEKNAEIMHLQAQLNEVEHQIQNLEYQHRDDMQKMHNSFDQQIQQASSETFSQEFLREQMAHNEERHSKESQALMQQLIDVQKKNRQYETEIHSSGNAKKDARAYRLCLAMKGHLNGILKEKLEESLFEATENEEVIQQQRKNMTQSLFREQQLQSELRELKNHHGSAKDVEELRLKLMRQEAISSDLTQKMLDAMAQVSRKEEEIRVLKGKY
jgi:hypothetical protein